MKTVKQLEHIVNTYQNKCLYVHLADGDYYIIHPNGNIEITDMFHPPSGQWVMVGLKHINARFDSMIPLCDINPEWVKTNNLKRFRIIDWDHGGYREQEITITNITFYDRPEDTNYYQYSREYLRRNHR